MKIRNLSVMFLLSVLWCGVSFSQAFQSTISRAGIDFNHYSIETVYSGGGGYICAGTMFDPVNNNNDMHIFMLDPSGNMVWERMIDETFDDRLLDVAVDSATNNGIVITGYITPNPAAPGQTQMYVANLDMGGNIIADKRVTNFSASVGTNVIYSWITRTWTVGGFYADQATTVPITSNEAILVEFDLNLNLVNYCQLSTNMMNHSSINDIVEIPGDGYFVTGTVGIPWGFPTYALQGVLAVKIDYAYTTVTNLSFESTNSRHQGVSVVYEASTDQIFLMSNNSIIHCPQITTINNVTGTPVIAGHNQLALDPTFGMHNAAGFELKRCPWNQGSLIACGYFKTYNDGVTPNNAIPWIVEFDKTTGANINTYLWQYSSPNFYAHGGGVLSTFTAVHPYIFNQEILTERADGLGFAFVGPREVAGNYGIDVVTTFWGGGMPCYSGYGYSVYTGTHNTFSVNATFAPVSISGWGGSTKGMLTPSNVAINCPAMIGSSSPLVDEGVESNDSEFGATAGILGLEEEQTLQIMPNPFKESFRIQLTGSNLTGYLTVRNSVGQIVYQSEQLSGNAFVENVNAEQFSNGIYIVIYSDENGVLKTEKVVKM